LPNSPYSYPSFYFLKAFHLNAKKNYVVWLSCCRKVIFLSEVELLEMSLLKWLHHRTRLLTIWNATIKMQLTIVLIRFRLHNNKKICCGISYTKSFTSKFISITELFTFFAIQIQIILFINLLINSDCIIFHDLIKIYIELFIRTYCYIN
jgi:hypothetical protein